MSILVEFSEDGDAKVDIRLRGTEGREVRAVDKQSVLLLVLYLSAEQHVVANTLALGLLSRLLRVNIVVRVRGL